ncbi:MAG: carboxypeptidase regulatory-like domain-containing protein [Thermoflexibacter sp.]|nr:carboxypeptidase regulatory-like domain-containing protein [Thermoflexibacter sp.]
MTHHKLLKSCFLAFILLFLSLVAHAQLTATVNIVGAPSSKTADWTGQFRKNRILVTVVNPRLQITEGILRVQLLNGSGSVIAETIDDQQTLQQFNNGSTLLDLSEVLPQYGNAYRLNDASLRERFESGFIPEDNYQICVNIIDVTSGQPLLPAPICKFIRVIGYQAPILVFPANNTEVKLGSRPILRWNGVSPRPAGLVKYRLQVFEIIGTQSPEIAFRTNVPYVDEIISNQTQWIWESSYELPKAGFAYVWTVQALDEDDKPIGEPNGQAAPFIFKIPQASTTDKEKEEEAILAEKTLENGKIRFSGVVKDNVLKNKMVANATVTIDYTGTEIKYRKKTETYTETVSGRRVDENKMVPRAKADVEVLNLQKQGRIITSSIVRQSNVVISYYYMTPPTTVTKTRQIDEPYTEKASKTIDVITDVAGKFSFDVEDGQSITLLGKAKGYFDGKPEKAQISVPQGSKVVSGFSLFLDPKAGSIEGIVTNAQTKRGIAGIVVEAFKASDTKKAVASGITNSSGAFSFRAEVGDYVLKVNDEQYEQFTSKNINVRPEETVKSDVILKPFTASVAGRITINNTNQPVVGAKVAVFTQSGIENYLYDGVSIPFSLEVTTGSDGSYEINDIAIGKAGLENESYVVFAKAEGYSEAWKAVFLKKSGDRVQADLKLSKRSSILVGTITDNLGDKVGKVKVDVYEANGTLYKSVMSDGNGEYTLKDVPTIPKLGKIVFFKDGWSLETVTGTFAEFKSLYVADIVLKKNPPITVRGIIKNQFGEAFEGVTVTCEGKNVTTDKQGKFVIENTSIFVQKSLTLSKAGETKEVSFTAKISPSWELEETLLEIKRNIVLKFVDESGAPLTGVSFTLKDPDGKEVGKEKLSNAEWSKLIYGNASWVGKKFTLSWSHPNKDAEDRNIEIENKDWFVSKTAFSYTLIEKTITIRGKITNKETSAGIDSVFVSINGSNFSAFTDQEGNYSIPKVPFQEKWQLKGEKKNFTSNVLDVTNPTDNQNFTLKRNFVNPENIFGFKATVSKVKDVGNNQFEIDGTLEIPQGSEITNNAGKVDFKSLKVDVKGVPLSNNNDLGSNLIVRIHDVPGRIDSVKLQYVSVNGALQATNQTGGIGVLTGAGKIEKASVKNSKYYLPEFKVSTNSAFPLGIRSSGASGDIKLKGEGGTQFLEIDMDLKDGILNNEQVATLNAKLTVSKASVKDGKASFTFLSGEWRETNFEGAITIKAETREQKHLYTLEGDVLYDISKGDKNLVLANPKFKFLTNATTFEVISNSTDKSTNRLKIVGAEFVGGVTVAKDLDAETNFGGKEKGVALADQKINLVAKLDLLGIPIGIDPKISKTSIKTNKNGALEIIFSANIFEQYFNKATQVYFSLSAGSGIKVALESEGIKLGGIKGKGKGLDVVLNKLVLSLGSASGEYFEFAGEIKISFGSDPKKPSNVTGKLDARLTWLNEQANFKVNKMGVKIALTSGFNLEGDVAFPEGGVVDGKLNLKIERKPANFVLNTTFKYMNVEDFYFSLYVETGRPIIIGSVAIAGLGGEIGRKEDVWLIGIKGKFIPSTEVASPEPSFTATLAVRVIFGGDEFTVQGEGKFVVKDHPFAEVILSIDFVRKRFDGTVKVVYDKQPTLYTIAKMNAYVNFENASKVKFRVWGNTDMTVLGANIKSNYFLVGNEKGYLELAFDYGVGKSDDFSFGPLKGNYGFNFEGRLYANENFDIDASVSIDASVGGNLTVGRYCVAGIACVGPWQAGGFNAGAGFSASIKIRGGRDISLSGRGRLYVEAWIGDCGCGTDCNNVCGEVRWCGENRWWLPSVQYICGGCVRAKGCFSANFSVQYDRGGWKGSFN